MLPTFKRDLPISARTLCGALIAVFAFSCGGTEERTSQRSLDGSSEDATCEKTLPLMKADLIKQDHAAGTFQVQKTCDLSALTCNFKSLSPIPALTQDMSTETACVADPSSNRKHCFRASGTHIDTSAQMESMPEFASKGSPFWRQEYTCSYTQIHARYGALISETRSDFQSAIKSVRQACERFVKEQTE